MALVRAMLAGLAEELAFDAELLADLKTAVSEACNNVVVHAYPGGGGPMTVRLTAQLNGVEVAVSDEGVGIANAGVPGRAGVGLTVVRALAQQVTFLPSDGRGTHLRMRFVHRNGRVEAVPGFAAPGSGTGGERAASRWATGTGSATSLSATATERVTAGSAPLVPAPAEAVVMTLSSANLLSSVLGRVAGVVAAEADFSVDRYSDLYRVTDAVAAAARKHRLGAAVSAVMSALPKRIELRLGPLRPGAGERLQSGGAFRFLVKPGAAELRVESADDGETLLLRLVDSS